MPQRQQAADHPERIGAQSELQQEVWRTASPWVKSVQAGTRLGRHEASDFRRGLRSLAQPDPAAEHGQDGFGALRRAELGQQFGLLAQPGEAGQQVQITGGIGRGNGQQER